MPFHGQLYNVFRNKASSGTLGKAFGTIVFYGTDETRPESSAASALMHVMVSEAKKLVGSFKELSASGTDEDSQPEQSPVPESDQNHPATPDSNSSTSSRVWSPSSGIKAGPLMMRKDNLLWKEVHAIVSGTKLLIFANRRVMSCMHHKKLNFQGSAPLLEYDLTNAVIKPDPKSNKRFSFEVDNQVFNATNESDKQSWLKAIESVKQESPVTRMTRKASFSTKIQGQDTQLSAIAERRFPCSCCSLTLLQEKVSGGSRETTEIGGRKGGKKKRGGTKAFGKFEGSARKGRETKR